MADDLQVREQAAYDHLQKVRRQYDKREATLSDIKDARKAWSDLYHEREAREG